jgi:hypothetical protein
MAKHSHDFRGSKCVKLWFSVHEYAHETHLFGIQFVAYGEWRGERRRVLTTLINTIALTKESIAQDAHVRTASVTQHAKGGKLYGKKTQYDENEYANAQTKPRYADCRGGTMPVEEEIVFIFLHDKMIQKHP